MPEPKVNLAADAAEVGLAVMLSDLIRQNLEQKPERMADFNALNSRIVIKAQDIDVSVTLDFKAGSVDIYGGDRGSASIVISTDADTVLSLSAIKITWGMPNYLEKAGRQILKKLWKGELKIDGMFSSPGQLHHLTKLFSVK